MRETKLAPPNYDEYPLERYFQLVSSPSSSRKLKERIIKLIRESQKATRDKVNLLDVGIHVGEELNWSEIKKDKNLQIIGVDIAKEILVNHTRKRFKEAWLVCGDTKNFPIQKETVDCGLAINALMFNPKELLASLYQSLKPGGKAIVNTWLFDTMFPRVKKKQIQNGCEYALTTINFGNEKIQATIIDYSNHQNEVVRSLGAQTYPNNEAEARKLFELSGFEVVSFEVMHYQKKGKRYKTNVFVIQKPLHPTS